MHGIDIALRTISKPTRKGATPKPVQYHPRSDHHSKVICWGIVFDLLNNCKLLQEHAKIGKIGIGINHKMTDFKQNRSKDLDLVICFPEETCVETSTTLEDLGKHYKIQLSNEEKEILGGLPNVYQAKVGTVLVALEAKACMTAHQKARPRLYDELSSSSLAINGDTNTAIGACHILINSSSEFVSPTRQGKTNFHNQPKAAKSVLEKVKELSRRSSEVETGFDAVGVSLVDCKNDGSRVHEINVLSDGTKVPSVLTYEEMISRISKTYSARWKAL